MAPCVYCTQTPEHAHYQAVRGVGRAHHRPAHVVVRAYYSHVKCHVHATRASCRRRRQKLREVAQSCRKSRRRADKARPSGGSDADAKLPPRLAPNTPSAEKRRLFSCMCMHALAAKLSGSADLRPNYEIRSLLEFGVSAINHFPNARGLEEYFHVSPPKRGPALAMAN